MDVTNKTIAETSCRMNLISSVISFHNLSKVKGSQGEIEAVRKIAATWKSWKSVQGDVDAAVGSGSVPGSSVPNRGADMLLAEFNQHAATMQFEKMVASWMRVAAAMPSDSFVREVGNTILSLPGVANEVLATMRAIDGIQSAAKDLNQGKSVGLAIMTLTLSRLHGMDQDSFTFKNTDGFDAMVKACHADWKKAVDMLHRHLDESIVAVTGVVEKFKGIDAAVEKWEFSGFESVVGAAKTSDTESDNQAKAVARAVSQMTVWNSQVGSAEKYVNPWFDSEDRKLIGLCGRVKQDLA
eukprot:7123263-Pyramimonas_sp.AAC.1